MESQNKLQPYLDLISQCALFKDVAKDDIIPVLTCLNARIASYGKHETIFHQGDLATKVGVLLSGKVQAVRTDYYGNRSILNYIPEGEVFGASYACIDSMEYPINMVSVTSSVVMFIDCKRVPTTCRNSCSFHSQIIQNLLTIVCKTNVQFNQKIEIVSKRNTRDKLMTYLLMETGKAKTNVIDIPFDRQELADYLEVDRSGLSSEIGKLKKEGYILCEKNHFEILKPTEIRVRS